jgi:hypothetical protein
MADATQKTSKTTEKKPRPVPVEVAFTVATPPAGVSFTPVLGQGKERSEYMKQLDELVKAARADGQPRYLVCDSAPDKVAELEKNIRRAGDFTENGIRMGAYQKGPKPGTVYVSFIATEKIRRPRKPKTETAPETPENKTPESSENKAAE